jgi:hypothetical protein
MENDERIFAMAGSDQRRPSILLDRHCITTTSYLSKMFAEVRDIDVMKVQLCCAGGMEQYISLEFKFIFFENRQIYTTKTWRSEQTGSGNLINRRCTVAQCKECYC